MNAREANIVITKAGLIDGRKSSPEMATAWAEVMPDVELGDALEAVMAHYRESTQFVKPADIVARVKVKRHRLQQAVESKARHDEAASAIGDAGTVGSLVEWYREQKAREGAV